MPSSAQSWASPPSSSVVSVTTNEALVSSSAPPKDEAKSITFEFAPATMLLWTKIAPASSVLMTICAKAFDGSVPATVYSTVALPE